MMATKVKANADSRKPPASGETSATGPGTATLSRNTDEAMVDLEKRLALLGSKKDNASKTADVYSAPPLAAKQQVGSKQALLARIKAAQDRAEAARKIQQEKELEATREMAELTAEIENCASLLDEEDKVDLLITPEVLPPPFEEVMREKEENNEIPPPSFEEALFIPLTAPTPSAPDLLSSEEVHPEFNLKNDESEAATRTVEIDMNGNQMTPEQQAAMIEEQKQILEQIQSENDANMAAIAACTTDNNRNQTVTQPITPSLTQTASASETADTTSSERTVQISGGHSVPLFGQERTRKAIKEGTAILVQCLSCENWMQVTHTATLMFCPVCSVVSPVQKQTAVWTKEEAVQMTLDRKLAEKIQKEEWGENQQDNTQDNSWGSSWLRWTKTPGTRAETAVVNDTNTNTQQDDTTSWGDYLSTMFTPNKDTHTLTSSTNTNHSAEISVTRPPHGAISTTTAPILHQHVASSTAAETERQSLLGMGEARVAERKPLFSCVVESVNSVASTLGRTLIEEEVHGVDSSPLILTQVGREGLTDDEEIIHEK